VGAGLSFLALQAVRLPYRLVPPCGAGVLSFASPKESSQRKGEPGSASLLRSDSLRYSELAGAAQGSRCGFIATTGEAGRLFFGDFLLAKQKKVTRPAGRNQTLATSTHMDQTP
jgi:hypothetical protein